MSATRTLTPEDAAALVARAAGGDANAWDGLVAAYGGRVWTVVRSHRLDSRDAADVAQTTWLRLVEHVDRLSEPSRVAAWLVTTARRESLRVLARSKRTVLVAEHVEIPAEGPSFEDDVDASLLRLAREEALRDALAQLPARQRELMSMLMAEPAPSYEEISAALSMPIGSIGPTRMRCLSRLRQILAASGICADGIHAELERSS